MLKMLDVLEKNLVQNFILSLQTPSESLDEQFKQGLTNVPNHHIETLLSQFLQQEQCVEMLHAIDLTAERVQALQHSQCFTTQDNLTDTAKVMALYLAIETNTLAQVDIAQCLQDYPM